MDSRIRKFRTHDTTVYASKAVSPLGEQKGGGWGKGVWKQRAAHAVVILQKGTRNEEINDKMRLRLRWDWDAPMKTIFIYFYLYITSLLGFLCFVAPSPPPSPAFVSCSNRPQSSGWDGGVGCVVSSRYQPSVKLVNGGTGVWWCRAEHSRTEYYGRLRRKCSRLGGKDYKGKRANRKRSVRLQVKGVFGRGGGFGERKKPIPMTRVSP